MLIGAASAPPLARKICAAMARLVGGRWRPELRTGEAMGGPRPVGSAQLADRPHGRVG